MKKRWLITGFFSVFSYVNLQSAQNFPDELLSTANELYKTHSDDGTVICIQRNTGRGYFFNTQKLQSTEEIPPFCFISSLDSNHWLIKNNDCSVQLYDIEKKEFYGESLKLRDFNSLYQPPNIDYVVTIDENNTIKIVKKNGDIIHHKDSTPAYYEIVGDNFTYLAKKNLYYLKNKSNNGITLTFFTIEGEKVGSSIKNVSTSSKQYFSNDQDYIIVENDDNHSSHDNPKKKKIPNLSIYTTQGEHIKDSDYIPTGELIYRYARFLPNSNYYYVKSSPAFDYTANGMIHLYEIKNHRSKLIQVFEDVSHLTGSPDGKYFFLEFNDNLKIESSGELYLIEEGIFKKIKTFNTDEKDKVIGLPGCDSINFNFLSDTKNFWIKKNKLIKFFTISNEQAELINTIPGLFVNRVASNDTKNDLCLIRDHQLVTLCTLEGKKLSKQLPYNPRSQFSPNYEYLFSINEEKTGQLMDREGQLIGKPLHNIQEAAFLGNSQFYFVITEENTGQLYNINGEPVGKKHNNVYNFQDFVKIIKKSPFYIIQDHIKKRLQLFKAELPNTKPVVIE